jgi:hypothetical protein
MRESSGLFEERLLMRVFESKREECKQRLRKLSNEKLRSS